MFINVVMHTHTHTERQKKVLIKIMNNNNSNGFGSILIYNHLKIDRFTSWRDKFNLN